MATKKTCNRCKGKGWGKWIPENGRCYKCFGTGIVVVYTPAEKKAREIRKLKKAMTEAEGIAADWRAAYARRKPTTNPETIARRERLVERHLIPLREQWQSMKTRLTELEAAANPTNKKETS